MGRGVGNTGKAAVLDSNEIKRLIKIAGTTGSPDRDQTVVVLSYWLGLRAKELASLKLSDVFDDDGSVKPVLHLKAQYRGGRRISDQLLRWII